MTTPTKEHFQRQLGAHPGLCALGYCGGRCEPHERNRQELLGDYEAVCFAYEWLQGIPRVKQRCYTSYAWKHAMERATGCYVTNGAFIAAAMLAGVSHQIPTQPYRGMYLNVPLGLSVRYLRGLPTTRPALSTRPKVSV